METKRYFLCSQEVIDFVKPNATDVSMPFKSGYNHDKDDDYFVVALSYDDYIDCEKYFQCLPDDEKGEFWMRELVAGTMDISRITLKNLSINGIFFEVELSTNLTTDKNRAMVLHNLSKKYNCTPIDLINKVVKKSRLKKSE